MNEVFVDASYWVALVFARDVNNQESVIQWQGIMSRGWGILTTNWTLYEAITILNGRRVRRHDLAVRLLNLAQDSVEIVDASEYEQQALEIFRSHTDKRWSIVDCANFVCIRERQSTMALSFDRDFAQAQAEFGFAVLGAGAS
jgi:predicted nucleic acid-binding protein